MMYLKERDKLIISHFLNEENKHLGNEIYQVCYLFVYQIKKYPKQYLDYERFIVIFKII